MHTRQALIHNQKMRRPSEQRAQRLPPPHNAGVAVEILVPGSRRRTHSGGGSSSGGGGFDAAPVGMLGRQGLEAKLRAARSSGALNLACLGLKAVPPEALSPYDHLGPEEKAWEVLELQKVDLSMNDMDALPAEIDNWAPALRTLLCRQNRLAAVPPQLFSLSSLVTLDLSSNGLTAFGGGDPALLQGLPALKELNLRGNQLAELSASLGVRFGFGGWDWRRACFCDFV